MPRAASPSPLLLLGFIALVLGCSSSREDTQFFAKSGSSDSPAIEAPVTYAGVLPCAGCPGIDTTLTLLEDGTFRLREAYRDRPAIDHDLGRWTIEESGHLALRGETGRSFRIVGGYFLELLDKSGAPIASQAPHLLSRAAQVDRIRDMMPMRGTYSTMADAGRFTECRSGAALPVAPTGAHAQLETAYAGARRDPGVPLLVDFMGHFEELPAMEGERQIEHVVVDVFQRVERDATCDEPSPLYPRK
ncbi:MAG TPA: copper resistance protein NlpE N-terminal domain-containing protein [Candidatus Polarisedimenticolia bacterium]|nr:copper resistance protein NlpE N-terminal domain-containing protein [Candidatus Polarisedimenticolia bacterium]